MRIKIKTRALPLGFWNKNNKVILLRRIHDKHVSYVYRWDDSFLLQGEDQVGFSGRMKLNYLRPIWTKEDLEQCQREEADNQKGGR